MFSLEKINRKFWAFCFFLFGFLSIYSLAFSQKEGHGDDKIIYTKAYKYITQEGNSRLVERTFIGYRNELTNSMQTNEVRGELKPDQFTKFSTASFFPEGEFEIPDDKKQKAKTLYAPLLETILNSMKSSKELKITIVILGYTDETNKEADSKIYDKICKMNNRTSMDEVDYKKQISYLRAKELSRIISNLVKDKYATFKKFDRIIIDIITEGKSTILPEKDRAYKPVDPRRRITKVYWDVADL